MKLNYVIFQVIFTPALDAVRRISKDSVKVYAWVVSQVAYLIDPYAPAKWGGRGDLYSKIEEEVSKSGKSSDEVALEVSRSLSMSAGTITMLSIYYIQLLHIPAGRLIQTPGLPPMYDYERIPQTVSASNPL